MSERRRPCSNDEVKLIRASTVDELADFLWPLIDDPDQVGIEALAELVSRARKLEANQ